MSHADTQLTHVYPLYEARLAVILEDGQVYFKLIHGYFSLMVIPGLSYRDVAMRGVAVADVE
ncbi:MAG: hypothetical protein WCA51_07155 [Dehalococcoidia bacterium]